jgi:hypothetical protein
MKRGLPADGVTSGLFKIPFVACGALAIAVAAGFCFADSASSPPAADKREPHVRLLELLRSSDSVLPPALERIELYSLYNLEAPIPPQCYTRTEGRHNPCYVCHQGTVPGRENAMDDANLQAEYSFSEIGVTNHWTNLFEDRAGRVARISDEAIRTWIGQDNYSELPARLRAAKFEGWIPDLANLQQGAAAFDGEGFAKDGSHWIAINYKPFPSTFWPTNGSTDDVMIRLPEQFRQDASGSESRDVYLANLAVVEASIKGLAEVGTWRIDENSVGVDLDGNGVLGPTTQVKARDHYVGAAAATAVEPTVYPQNTEFLHTVRYIGIAADGGITNATRMKEVRYMRRWLPSTRERNKREYALEAIEKRQGETPAYLNFGHGGLATRTGWQIAGFIEDRTGRLRANTFEENMFCMGCHNSIGSTVDKTFSFARKRDGATGWGYITLKGMPDAPNRGESKGEIATYLERVGGGSEFRSNPEMQARWYHGDGSLNRAAVSRAKDVYELIAPSAARALQLNKAYKIIVEDQSYLYGRDPTISPPRNVYHTVDAEKAPTLPNERQYPWDIRLSWPAERADGRLAIAAP